MNDVLIDEQERRFLIHDWLNTESLCQRPRFADHQRETLDAALDVAEQLARELLLPHNARLDANEPTFDGQQVQIDSAVGDAYAAIAEAGFLASREPLEAGGGGLPETVALMAMASFMAANPATSGYPFLTLAAARLVRNFATNDLAERVLPGMRDGRIAGTMALTEPQAGSSLADIRTRATPQPDGHYYLKGNKIYISGGDQPFTENIVHLVLARIDNAPAGTRGISLFLVPKYHLTENGNKGERNDVALAGLFHKLGFRGTTSTALNFGEHDACLGFLIGEAHQGLRYMFQMMNEARLGVGLGAAALAYRGYKLSLDYARGRQQGRHPDVRDMQSQPVAIIDHADVKRMLLQQKVYAEGGLALALFGGRLVDDVESLEEEGAADAAALLDLMTPIIKAWCSDYGVRANDLAIQVLGGAGYTREYSVEQVWRDNRLNPIHEGTNGIQALDLLGRKVWQKQSKALQLLRARMQTTLAKLPDALRPEGKAQTHAMQQLATATQLLGQRLQTEGPRRGLAQASSYLTLFGHVVVAWLWLDQAAAAQRLIDQQPALSSGRLSYLQGKILAARFFCQHELPQTALELQRLQSGPDSIVAMQADNF